MGERVVIDPVGFASHAAPPLDYGRGGGVGAWPRVRGAVHERADGILHFLGMVVAFLGGGRQVGFAIGASCLVGGLGMALQMHPANGGHGWMALGAFILGLYVPVSRKPH